MSSEYTIDIQLTELGFPDILETLQTPTTRITSPVSSPCDSISPRSTSPPLASTSQDTLLASSDLSEVDVAPLTALSVPHSSLFIQQTTSASADGTDHLVREGESREIRFIDGENEELDENTSLEKLSEESDDSEVSEMEEELDDDDDEQYGLDKEVEGEGFSNDHRCGVCDLQLPSAFKLQEHMNLHMGVRPYCCAECGKSFCHLYNYRSHLRTHAKSKLNSLRCRICQEDFQTEKDLKNHLGSTHFEKEFYECGLCKLVFTCKKRCERHLEWHKQVLGKHVCKTCGRHFLNTKSLVRHHLRNRCLRSYSCADCSRCFIGKNALLKHSFSHLGLLPYTCVQCCRHFRLANLYRKHKCEPERIHCVACLGVFLSQEDFQKHKKDTGCWGNQGSKGDEIRCMECGQSFASAEELKKHAGAHQRVMSCSECGKGFRSSLMLMSHMGGHAAQRPCLCQSCGFGFPHQQAFDSHLKTCGTTPPPLTAAKKRPIIPQPTEKTTSPTALKLDKIPIPWNKPAKQSTGLRNNSSDKLKDFQEIWKLALDKELPPGLRLVMLVPVNSGVATLTAPSMSSCAPLPSEIQPQPYVVALPPPPVRDFRKLPQAQSSYASTNPSLAQLHSDVLLDKSSGLKESKQKVDCLLPLDLSKKSKTCSASKTQPTDSEISNKMIEQEKCNVDGIKWAVFKLGANVKCKTEIVTLNEAPEATDHSCRGDSFTCPVEMNMDIRP